MSPDHLGTSRLTTDGAASVIAFHDYLPFGEEIPSGVGGRTPLWGLATDTNHKFAGKERDQETGLDYFAARYYGSALGRFTSPDWSAKEEPVPYAKLDNPQSLNLYAYVGNNPLSKADGDGHTGPDETEMVLAHSYSGESREHLEAAARSDAGIILNLASLVPGPIGRIAAAANALGSFFSGDSRGGSLSLAAAIIPGGKAAGRASELAKAMGKGEGFITVAVTETKQGISVVSSSENALRPGREGNA